MIFGAHLVARVFSIKKKEKLEEAEIFDRDVESVMSGTLWSRKLLLRKLVCVTDTDVVGSAFRLLVQPV